MIGRGLVELVTEELPQRQRISHPPSDRTLRVDALEIPDHEQAEVHPGRNARPTDALGVILRALRFDKRIKTVFVQHPIQLLVERMAWSRQILRGHPQLSLALALPSA